MAGSGLAMTGKQQPAVHDIRAIRADPEAFEAALRRRGLSNRVWDLLDQDVRRRELTTIVQGLQAERRLHAMKIGEAKKHHVPSDLLEERARQINAEIAEHERKAPAIEAELRQALDGLPNILDADVPDGADETANVVLKQVGAPPTFDFPPCDHVELGEALDLLDFSTAAKIAGARFTILRGALARLERALGQFMLDLHTCEHGYAEMSVPLLVNDAAVYGTGQLPKFYEDLFRTTDGRWLIPTAEVPLTNTVAGDILAESRLPIRLTALTDCFRSEAGSAGRDTRGMLRQHQFKKVELVSITRPEDSDAEHERMTRCAETVLERLNLPYRRVLLCAGDTGFSAAKTFDLEVWLPGQKAWREISSCSNCRAFQSRRMNARYRTAEKKIEHVHTLNGSGVAVGRALIAVMENFQRPDRTIHLPDVLRPYLGGLDRIG
jgi:seryl-tRNA synthetase